MKVKLGIGLYVEADKVNANGVLYTKECLEDALRPEKLAGLPVAIDGETIGNMPTDISGIDVSEIDGRFLAAAFVDLSSYDFGTFEIAEMDAAVVRSMEIQKILLTRKQ